jgi:uncharacterized protein YjbI with pentapeptide repeats
MNIQGCSGKEIYSDEAATMRETLEAAVNAKVDLFGADLSGADLSGADLSHARLPDPPEEDAT